MPDRGTPLDRIFAIFGLKPLHVVATAKRIARELGAEEGISRQQLLRIRKGLARATDYKIFLIVAAIRELTGDAVRASDLFRVEPELAEGMPYLNPVSSPAPRGLTLPESTPTGEAEFEALYVQ